MSTIGKERPAVRQLLAALTLAALTPVLMAAEENGAKADKTPPAAATQANPQTGASEAQIKALQEKIKKQQAQIDQLLGAVDKLQKKLDGGTPSATPAPAALPSVGTIASTTPVVPRSVETSAPSVAPVASPPQGEESSPLQFKVGSAYITPVGFMDFTSIWRSHDGGSGIGTNFASIPYGSTSFQGNLSEFRLSMQNSRIGFRVDADVKGAHAIGYMEADFLGNNPGNVAVSSNSNTLRSRLYWVDVRKGAWEVLGGQTWSLITPGRTGISPLPGDLFFSQNIDVNYQLGLVWGRIPELRAVYHAGDKAAFALALDSPEQYVGGSAGGGLITLPSALNTSSTYQGELNIGSNTLNVPNVAPDIIAKLALDPSKRVHFEVGGIERNFKVWNPATSTTYTAQGGGGFLNLNVGLVGGLRFLTNNFVSDGGGRYIFGQAPDLIAHADGSISLIHADSTVTGFELTHKNTLLYTYYGGLYVYRNTAVDTGGTLVGYGYSGAPAGQNRAVQEATFGFTQTFWKNAKYGALSLMGQYSYLTRNPWSVAAGKPSNAELNMVFMNLRYTLPGSAPTLGK
jgi:hypothetical protein